MRKCRRQDSVVLALIRYLAGNYHCSVKMKGMVQCRNTLIPFLWNIYGVKYVSNYSNFQLVSSFFFLKVHPCLHYQNATSEGRNL